MGLKVIDEIQAEDEIYCQDKIFNHIKSYESFVFNAGAGSGKTYSLKESIMYTLQNFSDLLDKRKQRILCITYTNLAAKEIKKRLGNSELAIVCTIHEAMWDIIKNQQSALKNIHKGKISKEIKRINESFKSGTVHYDWFYAQECVDLRNNFYEKLIEKETIDLFYKSKKRRTISDDFSELLEKYGYTMTRNKGKFESFYKYVLEINKLTTGLENIEEKPENRISYNTRSNFDRLHKMEISHDTLLEYVYDLCFLYPKMCDIFIDKFPFIFIDEYQDTHPSVVKTLSLVSKRAKERSRNFCVGYFGDAQQSIYPDGIGSNLDSFHCELKKIEKKQNRRSYSEIINIFDQFRNDNLSQISIYKDNVGGLFKYYSSKIDGDESKHIGSIIDSIRSDFNLGHDSNISSLVMKNDTISDICGFPLFYRKIKSAFFYSDAPRLIINKDLSKLNKAVKEIYNLLDFLYIFERKNIHISDIIPKNIGRIKLSEVNNYYKELNGINLDNNLSFRENISLIFDNGGDFGRLFTGFISETISCVESDFTSDSFIDGVVDLLEESSSKDYDESTRIINDLFDIKLEEFKCWFNYLNSSVINEDVFITCHNSKGLEFETVIVFLSDSFNGSNNYLSAFFDDPYNNDYVNQRNLLYVSLSRAIKNLAVVYIYDHIEPSVNTITYFGRAQHI